MRQVKALADYTVLTVLFFILPFLLATAVTRILEPHNAGIEIFVWIMFFCFFEFMVVLFYSKN